jgi:hypothetical protein
LQFEIKRTPQQYGKSNNIAQDGEQYNAALRRRSHEKTQKKNPINVKSLIYIKRRGKKKV